MSIIPSIPEDVLDAARSCVASYTQFDRDLLEQAQRLALAAHQIVQRVGAIGPGTLREVIENSTMGIMPTHFDQDALGTLVQAGHTTAGYEQSHFYRGLLFGGRVIGYNNDWSRLGTTMGMTDASEPLMVTEFWGAMQVELPTSGGAAMPARLLMGLIKKTTDNIRVQWGFRLSPDYMHPGHLVPITSVISQN